jgi:hypothetical protein
MFLVVFIAFLLDCPVVEEKTMGLAPRGGIEMMAKENMFSCLQVRRILTQGRGCGRYVQLLAGNVFSCV